jgi:hypothetical protein
MGHGFRFLPPFLYYPPFFQNFHNYSFFKIFIIIRFSSFDNISRRHRSRIIRVFCVHSFSTDTVSVEKLWTQNTRWVFIVLAHWNNSPRVEMSLHWDTLFWFWANQSAFSPYCCVLSGEATHINFIVFDLTRSTGARTRDLLHSRRAR